MATQKVSTVAKRLTWLMNDRGMKQKDILECVKPYCEQRGVKLDKSHLSQYVNGGISPSAEKLTILAVALGVSEAWLLGYDVPMVDIYTGQNKSVYIDMMTAAMNRMDMDEQNRIVQMARIMFPDAFEEK